MIEEKREDEDRERKAKRAAKIQSVVDKIDDSSDSIKFWSKKIMALVAFTLLIIMAYNNGAFEKEIWLQD